MTGREYIMSFNIKEGYNRIPNSQESIWYPLEMVKFINAWALLEFQSPSHSLWLILCLPYSAFKPNVIIALQQSHVLGTL